jgi:hypothetical protein
MNKPFAKLAKRVLGLTITMAAFGAVAAWAQPPACMDHGQQLPVDNDRVLELKKSAPLGRSIRAHVSGHVTRVFPDRTNSHGTVHDHFEIQIGEGDKAVLEVVYSEDFGAMPEPREGAQVEACGDFINSYARNSGYDPSPSGAIIHWVHNTDTPSHDAGYVYMDNVLYGYGRDGHPHH